MAFNFTTFQATFPELFDTTITSQITAAQYDALTTSAEIEVMNWEGIICLPTGSTINISSVKNQATGLYMAHLILNLFSGYSHLLYDNVRKVKSLDNDIEFRDIKFNSQFDLLTSKYGVRLKDMLERYSCKRIRDEEYDALKTVHEFAGIGESFDDCCGDDIIPFGVLW